jgi:hypothetical protein
MNIFELAYVAVLLSTGYGFARLLVGYLGWAGWLFGLPAGVALAHFLVQRLLELLPSVTQTHEPASSESRDALQPGQHEETASAAISASFEGSLLLKGALVILFLFLGVALLGVWVLGR